jgi:tRNA threonylcarbamoyladenosine biosynthesis protein TsaB
VILGIDTAGHSLSVALGDGERICGVTTLRRPNAHDALLAPAIRDLLGHCGLKPTGLTGLAVSAGPGSFTGLRIGMAAAKGMAASLRIPLAAVPTLEALAAAVQRCCDISEGSMLVAALDARREQLYHASFILRGGRWVPLGDAALSRLEDLAASIPEDALLAGDGTPLLMERSRVRARALPQVSADASDIVLLGSRRIETGDTADPASCEPLYMQEFIVKQAKNALFPSSD